MISRKGGKHQVPTCWAMNPKNTGVSIILALEKAISMLIMDWEDSIPKSIGVR